MSCMVRSSNSIRINSMILGFSGYIRSR
jgi:hypothetical protein